MKARHLALAVGIALATSCTGSDTPPPASPPGGPVPIVDWITDLVKNPEAPPDTVEDKRLVDTEDPAAFDPLLADQ